MQTRGMYVSICTCGQTPSDAQHFNMLLRSECCFDSQTRAPGPDHSVTSPSAKKAGTRAPSRITFHGNPLILTLTLRLRMHRPRMSCPHCFVSSCPKLAMDQQDARRKLGEAQRVTHFSQLTILNGCGACRDARAQQNFGIYHCRGADVQLASHHLE